MKYKWVGLAGFGGAGKSAVAQYLQNRFGYKKLHVKDFLAESVHPILLRYGVPASELFQRTHGDLINDPLPGNPDLTTRKLLQVQGGEFLQATDPDMMSKFWCDQAQDDGGKFVAESIRYARESAYYRERGMFMIRITRPGHTPLAGTHMSEADQTFPVDAEIVNDGTLEELFEKVANLLGDPPRLVPIIINGPPRSGKDTLVSLFRLAAEQRTFQTGEPFSVVNISSIDGVRELLRSTGVQIDKKTPEQRRMLANLGDFLEEECRFKTSHVVDQACAALDKAEWGTTVFAFIHVREPEMIQRIEANFKAIKGVEPRSVFVDREPVEAVAVQNDDVRPTQHPYTWIVNNDGSLEDLEWAARGFFMVARCDTRNVCIVRRHGEKEYSGYSPLIAS